LKIATGLGETLEGCGFFSKAAQIYEEAAQYAFKSKHPYTSKLLSYAGLAWKRYGDREQAEIFYAAALHSMHLVYNHVEYRFGLFNVLTNLWMLWYDPDRDDCPMVHLVTLRALIIAAGERTESLQSDEQFPKPTHGSTFLCPVYHNAPKEQIYGAIQYIAVNSVSVEAMRDAVIKFANRHNTIVPIVWRSADVNLQRDSKKAAREFLLGDRVGPNSADFLAKCDACGQMKEEKKLKACPW
jgi:tetratricopeptide (TPR) repeat protein